MLGERQEFDWSCIHVWRVELGLSVPEPQLAAWWAMLSADERKRADAFRSADLRRDYVVCHVALRSVLGKCLGIAPSTISFQSGPTEVAGGAAGGAATGKPALDRNSGPEVDGLDLRFNLTHTLGAALIAVAQGREVGIDIEWQRPMDDLEGMARAVMSDEEHEQWQQLSSASQMTAFYRLWARKESYLKAIGMGLYRDLHEITVPVSANLLDPIERGLRVQDRAGRGLWSVADIPVEGPYAASVCCEGSPLPVLVIQDWQPIETASQ